MQLTAFLKPFFEEGAYLRRPDWPAGDHIMADGAEGGTIWYYSAANDELAADYKLGFQELAGLWEIEEVEERK
jgi:hypothetical protein